ncbi:MAG: long-chain fatty acid--CoA ligase [Desulfuromonadales bacterium]|nr:long-chain fatty acid--CoA ligase [Desulfuromonadales bacterium]
MSRKMDIISPQDAPTLPALFAERVRRTPTACAYLRFDLQGRCCDQCITWEATAALAGRWQVALRREGLLPGDRVAVMLRNSLEWAVFDQAALGLGLVTVPLFVNDRPDNFAYIIEQSEARFLLIEGVAQWEVIQSVQARLDSLQRIVTLNPACSSDCDPRLVELADWLPAVGDPYDVGSAAADNLASIVYTSGTTGNPKGVMLTHHNILANAFAGLSRVPIYPDDLFLSFLPLSHTLERTAGYYLAIMAGARVAHVRSLEKLADDLPVVRPTVVISVPRVFERIHARVMAKLATAPPWKQRLFALTVDVGWQRFLHQQGRGGWSPCFLLWPILQRLIADKVLAALGGRLRLAISGGAPLNPEVARLFIALGLPILQGYGLTETSPVVAVNSESDNRPETVGPPLPGVEVKIAHNGELLIRGECVMAGYWQNPAATAAIIDGAGWLHSGDLASITPSGHITITGRLKEIIVLSNGEKVPPADIELAIATDPLFEQVLVVGEGRPYLSALVVLNREEWEKLGVAAAASEEILLARIAARMAGFPGYAQIRRVQATATPWEVANGLLTATMKLRRPQLFSYYADEIAALYAGH